MDGIENFIKCPGILKKAMVKKMENVYRLERKFCAFFREDKIYLVKWKNDLTITMTQTNISILLELWKSGKRIKGKRWSNENMMGLFVACMNFYEIEEYIEYESENDSELKDFLF
jgi:hypothetical protein